AERLHEVVEPRPDRWLDEVVVREGEILGRGDRPDCQSVQPDEPGQQEYQRCFVVGVLLSDARSHAASRTRYRAKFAETAHVTSLSSRVLDRAAEHASEKAVSRVI